MKRSYTIEVSDERDEELIKIAESRGLAYDIGVLALIDEAVANITDDSARLTHTEK
jgi:hypothetical protein